MFFCSKLMVKQSAKERVEYANHLIRKYEGWGRQDDQQRHDGLPARPARLQDPRLRPGPASERHAAAPSDIQPAE